MPEVSVCQGVGANFEPNDYRVHLACRADTRMEDVVVDDIRGHKKIQCSIDAMCQRYEVPGGCEVYRLIVKFNSVGIFVLLGTANHTLNLLCCDQLDQIAHEKVRRY